MNPPIALRSALLLLLATVFSACAPSRTVRDLVTANIPTFHEGESSVVVKLHRQRAYLYRGRHVVGTADISTGREGYATPTGRFKVIRKDEDHRSSLYGDYVNDDGEVVKANVDVRKHPKPPGAHYLGAPMPFFVEFSPSYGLHAGHLPGRPASHGCVRLSYWKARQFYNACEIGTPVIVEP